MQACNASDPHQRWTLHSDNAISPTATSEQCITRNGVSEPLSLEVCRGRAGSLDPVQQWRFDADAQLIKDVAAQGSGGDDCVDIGMAAGTTEAVLHVQHPCKRSVNEHFAYDGDRGWIFSNCSGSNCNVNASGSVVVGGPLRPLYCATRAAATVGEKRDAALAVVVTAEAPSSCVPIGIDPRETRHGFYYDAGITNLLLSRNGTLVAFFTAEKYQHLDNDNWSDLVVRRSFDQGRTWSNFQLVFSPSRHFAPRTYSAEAATVLDRDTGTIWSLVTANNSMLLVTSSTDEGATWSKAVDITDATKPAGFGWIAMLSAGVQLAGGRLVVCADHVVGQWTAYPITHTISSTVYSDDHGATWLWSTAGSPDGMEMNECSVAQLPNKTLVMNSRNYLGQATHTVRRAIMWSDTDGASWSEPYLTPDLPSPICHGDMILGKHTPPSLGVGQPLLFSHPHSSLDRANGTLLMSTEESGGAAWTPVFQYQHGCHQYSQLVQFDDGKVGVAFDDGGPFPPNYDPASGTCKGFLTNVSYVLLELQQRSDDE